MNEIAFFDTNVLVYLFDSESLTKQKRARELVRQTVADGAAVISSQVLQEFYVTVTRKLAVPLAEEIAEKAVRDLAVLPLVIPDASMILSAIKRSREDRISFWDSLILEAALSSGATILFSEDFQHDSQKNGLTIQNPFV